MADVLVVDDNPVVRTLARIALECSGLDVREAADGVEAVRALASSAVDAVVLDIMMPRLSGHEVLEALQAARTAPGAGPPVLMLTCKTDEHDVERAFALGAADYMTKPFDPDALVVAVRALVYGGPSSSSR